MRPLPPLEVAVRHAGLHRFSESEVATFRRAGYGKTIRAGTRPVLLVVDATYEFCGRRDADAASHPKAGGAAAWDAIDRLASLVPAVRRAGIPVIYSRNAPRIHPVEKGSWGRKTSDQGPAGDLEIVAEIAPAATDLVVEKTKPSAFFATPLASWLLELGADTVLVTGGTTSGCVRATVTDAFSWNLRPFVVVDAVFDRSPTSHDVNLFEMEQKYAGLVETPQLLEWLAGTDDTTRPGTGRVPPDPSRSLRTPPDA
ncbi:MAG TPA: isochorismatase family protein [Longimicrobiales bacterium]|nr:isochorismatase family protein [Longimicrobiales bacterium]